MDISPACSLEGLMLKLKLQYFLATWCKELTHLKRPWCWEWLRAGGEGYNRGWDGWMASPTWWTWVWVDSGSWWWTGRPGMLRFMGSQRVRHDWVTELNWIAKNQMCSLFSYWNFVFRCWWLPASHETNWQCGRPAWDCSCESIFRTLITYIFF